MVTHTYGNDPRVYFLASFVSLVLILFSTDQLQSEVMALSDEKEKSEVNLGGQMFDNKLGQ